MKQTLSKQWLEDAWRGLRRRVVPGWLIIAVCLLPISNVRSQTWTGLGEDNLWDNPDNWDTGILPSATDETKINAPGADQNSPLIEDGIAAVCGILISDFGNASMSMTGGTLECAGWGCWWGDAPGSDCTFNMSGGEVNFTGNPGIMELGWQNADDPPGSSVGTWVMTGGSINAKGIDMPGKGNGGIAEIRLYGGTLNVGTSRGGLVMYTGGLVDITEGTLLLEGDEQSKVEDLVMRGQIVAYGGDGEVDYLYDGVNTIVTAIGDEPEDPTFVRGDANSSGRIDITDGIFILNFLFLGGPAPSCMDGADTNDTGAVDVSDGIGLFNYLFLGGAAPPVPFPDCGWDPTADEPTCESHPPCE